jgi:rod shape-determining protein MreD
MKLVTRRSRFDRDPSSFKIRWLPTLSVLLASMASVLPLIVVAPVMPPWGYMAFVAWRLMHRDIWHPWAGAALGFFDDMWSGQPLGSAILLWSLTLILIDLVDRRALWRDYWQDWALGGLACVGSLSLGLWIANFTGGHTHYQFVVPQILASALLFPLVMRGCARLDQWRFA